MDSLADAMQLQTHFATLILLLSQLHIYLLILPYVFFSWDMLAGVYFFKFYYRNKYVTFL